VGYTTGEITNISFSRLIKSLEGGEGTWKCRYQMSFLSCMNHEFQEQLTLSFIFKEFVPIQLQGFQNTTIFTWDNARAHQIRPALINTWGN